MAANHSAVHKIPLVSISLEPPFAEASSIYSQLNSRRKNVPTTPTPTANTTATVPQQQPRPRLPKNIVRPVAPAMYPVRDPNTGIWNLHRLSQTTQSGLSEYFTSTLDVSRLDKIHEQLWSAGLPGMIHPLHEQLAKGRSITVIEYADCHLIKPDETRIFIKPLEGLLLDFATWQDHICPDLQLHAAASGFLRSWLWLLCSENDYHVAIQHNLLPKYVTWEMWTKFASSVHDHLIDHQTQNLQPIQISSRYYFGELRLGRVNRIYRWYVGFTEFNTTLIFRGYEYTYTSYSSFLQRNTSWLLAVAVYATLVLSAMQVGLGTLDLQDDLAFNKACFGFAVFSILGPLIVLGVLGATVFVLVLFNVRYARSKWMKAKLRAGLVVVP